MTTKEFSDAFDTLLNGYSTQMNFGDSASMGGMVLDEYEKSLFLTQAQEQIIVELYTGRNDKTSSFEKTEELRSNLRGLIKTDTPTESDKDFKGISKYSKFFILPKDVLFITYEAVTLSDESAGCKNGTVIPVIPVTQDEFDRVMNNPFRQASKRRALRLDNGLNDNGLNIVEIVSKYNIKDYTIRYLSKPTPIVLANLAKIPIDEESIDEMSMDRVSIDGVYTITECKLDSAMHRYILERAVALAIASRGIQNRK